MFQQLIFTIKFFSTHMVNPTHTLST